MIVTLHTDHLSSLEQIERFLDGTTEIDFRAPDAKGRQRRVYRYEDIMTPFDKLASLTGVQEHLKPLVQAHFRIGID